MSAPAASPPKADATRHRILDSAAALFRARGYSAVSLRDIAAAADMKAGSVYYHFASKDEIVGAVLDIGISAVHEAVADAVAELAADSPATELLRTAMRSHLRALFEFSDYASANVRIYHHVPAELRRANGTARRRYERLWDELLRRAETQGCLRAGLDLKNFRLLLIGGMNATLDWFDGRRGQITALADSYADILLYGVLGEERR